MKGQMPDEKFKKAIVALDHALKFLKEAGKDPFYFSGISKSFEVCLEYAWKYLKTQLDQEGLEAYSPREIIKVAGRAGFIDNVEKWLDFLENRNLAVHDYLGLSEKQYLTSIQAFLREAKKLLKKY